MFERVREAEKERHESGLFLRIELDSNFQNLTLTTLARLDFDWKNSQDIELKRVPGAKACPCL